MDAIGVKPSAATASSGRVLRTGLHSGCRPGDPIVPPCHHLERCQSRLPPRPAALTGSLRPRSVAPLCLSAGDCSYLWRSTI